MEVDMKNTTITDRIKPWREAIHSDAVTNYLDAWVGLYDCEGSFKRSGLPVNSLAEHDYKILYRDWKLASECVTYAVTQLSIAFEEIESELPDLPD